MIEYDLTYCYWTTNMEWAHKATLAQRPFLIYCVSPSDL
jgi:hypothetical protein